MLYSGVADSALRLSPGGSEALKTQDVAGVDRPRIRFSRKLLHRLPALVLLGGLTVSPTLGKDRFDAFLEEVHWIASHAELESFKALKTDQEKDAFVERFWQRRDPSPDTQRNEFKEEHYRRWEYVNQNFREGVAGWRTDRGRVYLIHGPPDDQAFKDVPTRGAAGTRRSRQSVVWTYFQLPNSQYYRGRMVLVFQANIGLTEQDFTLGESRTALDKAAQQYQRAGVHPADLIDTAIRFRLVAAGPPTSLAGRGDDIPASGVGEYARYVEDVFRSPGEVLEEAEARRAESQRQLRQQIETKVSYGELTLKMVSQPFYTSEDYATVTVSWQVPMSDIAFRELGDSRVGQIDLFARVTDANGTVVDEFFKDFDLTFPATGFETVLKTSFRHLNEFHLAPGAYKINAIVKDLKSQKIGSAEEPVVCRNLNDGKLTLSGLVAASGVAKPDGERLGDLVVEGWQVVPEADLHFNSSDHLVLYLKVYNGAGSPHGPQVVVSANFSRDGLPFRKVPERLLTSYDDSAAKAMVYTSVVDLAGFEAGTYQLQVSAVDLVGKQFAYQRLNLDISKR